MKECRIPLLLAAAILALGLAPAAALADGGSGLSAGLALETTGYGVSVGYPLGANQEIRLQTGNYNYSNNFNASGGLQYTATLNLSNIRVEDDFHFSPGSGFFGAVGFMSNNNKVTANGTTAGTSVTIQGTTFTTSVLPTVNGTISWSNFVPYVGIGGAPLRKSGFGWDLGAAFQGTANVSIATNLTTAGVVTGCAPACAVVATAVNNAIATEQNQIQSALNALQVYPVVGIRYVWAF